MLVERLNTYSRILLFTCHTRGTVMSKTLPATMRLAGLAGALAIGLAACGSSDAADDPTPAPSETLTDDAAPTPDDATEPVASGDCSAATVTLDTPAFAEVPEATRATAEFLLDAALRCDEQLLVTAATEGSTRLTFGNAEPGEFLSLPEPADTPVYEIIARLLAGTTTMEADGDQGIWVWPAVTTGNGTDADWQSLVDSGLYTQAEADELRAAGDGYLGWRLGINAEGDWTFLVAGD